MSTGCATRTLNYKGYSLCKVKQELSISLKVGESCCYVLFEKLRLIKHVSMNISEPFQFALYFHRWQIVLFWWEFIRQLLKIHVKQKTIWHVFLSANDILKTWIITFYKFDQNLLNARERAKGKDYSTCKVHANWRG